MGIEQLREHRDRLVAIRVQQDGDTLLTDTDRSPLEYRDLFWRIREFARWFEEVRVCGELNRRAEMFRDEIRRKHSYPLDGNWVPPLPPSHSTFGEHAEFAIAMMVQILVVRGLEERPNSEEEFDLDTARERGLDATWSRPSRYGKLNCLREMVRDFEGVIWNCPWGLLHLQEKMDALVRFATDFERNANRERDGDATERAQEASSGRHPNHVSLAGALERLQARINLADPCCSKDHLFGCHLIQSCHWNTQQWVDANNTDTGTRNILPRLIPAVQGAATMLCEWVAAIAGHQTGTVTEYAAEEVCAAGGEAPPNASADSSPQDTVGLSLGVDNSSQVQYAFGIVLNENNHREVKREGRGFFLRGRQIPWNVLECLAKAGETCTYDQLRTAGWGKYPTGIKRIQDVVCELKKELGHLGLDIENIQGRGYRLRLDSQVEAEAG